MSLSALISLPSFGQGTTCEWVINPADGQWMQQCTQIINPNPWNGSGSSSPHPWDQNCGYLGCYDTSYDYDTDYDDYNPPSCTYSMTSELRERKQGIPGCFGDPGPTFNLVNWQGQVGLTTWEWLNAPIFILYNGIWSDTNGPLTVLVETLRANNSDMIAAYNVFAPLLYDNCIMNYTFESDEQNICLRSAYYLLDNYAPGTVMLIELVNWALGTNFDATDYNSSWGGKLTRDVSNHYACHEIYLEWEENDCSGLF